MSMIVQNILFACGPSGAASASSEDGLVRSLSGSLSYRGLASSLKAGDEVEIEFDLARVHRTPLVLEEVARMPGDISSGLAAAGKDGDRVLRSLNAVREGGGVRSGSEIRMIQKRCGAGGFTPWSDVVAKGRAAVEAFDSCGEVDLAIWKVINWGCQDVGKVATVRRDREGVLSFSFESVSAAPIGILRRISDLSAGMMFLALSWGRETPYSLRAASDGLGELEFSESWDPEDHRAISSGSTPQKREKM